MKKIKCMTSQITEIIEINNNSKKLNLQNAKPM